MLRVGVDVGCTLTDLFAWDGEAPEDSRVREGKVLTTLADPSVGAMDALKGAGTDPSTTVSAVHGTTSPTNALRQPRWRGDAVVTRTGFRAALEIGRQRLRRLSDPCPVRGARLIARTRRFTVDERMAADGTPVEPLDTDQAHRIA